MSLSSDGAKVFTDIQEALSELAEGVKDAKESARDSHRQHGTTQRNIANLERVLLEAIEGVHRRLDKLGVPK